MASLVSSSASIDIDFTIDEIRRGYASGVAPAFGSIAGGILGRIAALTPMIESRIRASIEAYVAAWNELDPVRRMQLIERACAEDLLMRTPGKSVDGRVALDALMADFQKRRPGERAVLSSAIDIQGHVFRYTGIVEGSLGTRGGDNFDAGECDDEGRIRLLLTFVGAALPSPNE